LRVPSPRVAASRCRPDSEKPIEDFDCFLEVGRPVHEMVDAGEERLRPAAGIG
jgi:hypothetical protein